MSYSEAESVDSSTSDSESGSGEDEEAEIDLESTTAAPRVLQEDNYFDGGSDVDCPSPHMPLKDGGRGESDRDMTSAVAAASQQASLFLHKYDEEQEDDMDSSKDSSQSNKEESLFRNVFGADGDSDSRKKMKKRHISEGESDQELDTPAKKRRIESSDEEVEDDDQVREREEVEEEGDMRGKGMSDSGEEKDDSDEDGVLGEEEEKGDEDEDTVASGGKEESGNESEEEKEMVELQEEVAELVNEVKGDDLVGEAVEQEGDGGGDDEQEIQGSDEELDDNKKIEGMSDWDMMMQRRKSAMDRSRRRRRRDGDITVHDDTIMDIIQKMREAAELDRQLNIGRKAATKKIQFLPTIMVYLKKADLQTNLIECGILSSLAEWLTPLPDHSLPHLKIRETILDTLKTFPNPDSSILKSSKIGKAVMLLYQHPKESRKNREKAGKLINEWSRPIFGLASDFRMMTRNEREERDYANLSQGARQKMSTGERRKSQDEDVEQPQKPGDKGWVGRARVPLPSTRGYVVRPKWNTEQEFHKKGSGKKTLNRYEKHLRKKKMEKMQNLSSHAVSISVEGRHMPL